MNLAISGSVFFFPYRHCVGWAGKQYCSAREIKRWIGKKKPTLTWEIKINQPIFAVILLDPILERVYVWMC